jgi:TnpA family transposase
MDDARYTNAKKPYGTFMSFTTIDDETKRRGTLIQLNRHEGRHSLARTVFQGKRGELRQQYREGRRTISVPSASSST